MQVWRECECLNIPLSIHNAMEDSRVARLLIMKHLHAQNDQQRVDAFQMKRICQIPKMKICKTCILCCFFQSWTQALHYGDINENFNQAVHQLIHHASEFLSCFWKYGNLAVIQTAQTDVCWPLMANLSCWHLTEQSRTAAKRLLPTDSQRSTCTCFEWWKVHSTFAKWIHCWNMSEINKISQIKIATA